jgi:hypothetical protein
MRFPAQLVHWASKKRPERQALFDCGGTETHEFVLVTELSLEGARLLTPAPLEIGGKVLLRLPMLDPVKARVVWVSNRIAGCVFQQPLHPAVFRVLLGGVQTGSG